MDNYIGSPSRRSGGNRNFTKPALEEIRMKWAPEAEEAIKKVPFFVRKRVKARVEKEAREAGRPVVSLADGRARALAAYENRDF